jgi:hypothetical protein
MKVEFSRSEIIAEKYEVVDLLGQNPIGLTYRVKHLKSGHYVRLTVLQAQLSAPERRQEVEEAYAFAKELDHPHLLKMGEFGEHEGAAYFTTEDFEAPTLRELIQEFRIAGRPFRAKEASQVLAQVLDAVAATNAAGKVIRALRPEYVSVQVRHTGPRQQTLVANVKLFGIGFWDLIPSAVLAEDEFTRSEAQYLAPELKSFQPVPTERSDVFSAGVMFYEMLVGHAPVGTFQLPRTQRPELPSHVDTVVELALAQAPDDRYQTARDCSHDIQRIFDDQEEIPSVNARSGMPWMYSVLGGIGLALLFFVLAIVYQPQDKMELHRAALEEMRLDVRSMHDNPTSDERNAIEAQHPPRMAYVPRGPYIRGRLPTETDDHYFGKNEPTLEWVDSVDGFLIDQLEHPNEIGKAPTSAVTFDQAENMCAEQGKRLCTDTEWEKACKGLNNNVYAYGDTFDEAMCGTGVRDVMKAGARSDCRGQDPESFNHSIYDMSGNFREWTSTKAPSNPAFRIVKGGLRTNPEKGLRCATTSDERAGFRDATLSFRCCRDASAPPIEP